MRMNVFKICIAKQTKKKRSKNGCLGQAKKEIQNLTIYRKNVPNVMLLKMLQFGFVDSSSCPIAYFL